MPFFRPATRALSHLLRHDPFHHSSPASLFSRHSPFAPLTRAFDDPFFSSPFSAPLYTVYEVRDEDNHNNTSNTNTKAEQPHSSTHEEVKAAEPQQQQQQQQQQRSTDNRLARHEDSHRQRWLDRRANRRQRHSHHNHHHPLSLLSSPFDSLLTSPFYAASSYQPLEITLDLYSTPAAYQVNAAIPGVRKEDIRLTVNDGVLSIEAERREERGRPNSKLTATAPSTATAAPSESSQAEGKGVEVDVKADTVSSSSGDSSQPTTQPAAQQSTATQPQHQQEQHQDEDVSVHHVESYYGRVQRSLALPDDVNVDGLTARYEDGVVRIELPRVEEKRQQVKQINIQ